MVSEKRQRRAAPKPRSERGSARGERSTWALDLHLTAPGAGEGDAAHRIDSPEPFTIRGVMWPTSEGEPVEVDVLIEELRAQILVPEEDLPRLQGDLTSVRDGRSRRDDRPKPRKTEALNPERVRGRARSSSDRRSRDE